MTLLDRFRTSPQKHPDPAVRLAHVGEIPLTERELIAAFARDDEDVRVRKAAVAKLLDPATLGAIARGDADESVRGEAATMLRDIALEAFEGVTEQDSLDAVDALTDVRALAQIAKTAGREIVALRALSRVSEPHLLGSIARHAESEAARRGAFERVRGQQAEVLAVALNGEFKDTTQAAVDLISDRAELEQIAARAKSKSAAKRARAIIRDAEEREAEARRALEAAHADQIRASDETPQAPPPANEDVEPQSPSETERQRAEDEELQAHAREEAAERLRAQAEAKAAAAAETARRMSEQRHARLTELIENAVAAASDADFASARRRFGIVRREWKDLVSGVDVSEALAARFAEIESQLAAREADTREADIRARREALARMEQLAARVEALAARPDLSLKAADRALHDIRAAIGAVPPLPSKQDYDAISARLKAALAVLTPKAQELREAEDWQRWANVGIQEQLCVKMEALKSLTDPEAIAREVRELQQQWKQAADVPRAQAEALWRRFKAAHDEVWPRCEAHFAAQAGERAENLAKKVALCEQAESLAESSRWIETAEAIKKLQAEWKTIGAVSRGREKELWDRFRAACDRFFTRRHEDLDRLKKVWAENFAKKEALCLKAETLADSTDWDAASSELKKLQTEWKAIGPVKKSRSEAIWQRFRGACDKFFARYAQRHDIARAERVAAREAICAELEALVPEQEGEVDAPPGLLESVRAIRARWQQEIAARGVDPDRARALDDRFAAAGSRVMARWPAAFAGTDLDPEANRKRMESIVKRVEDLAASLVGHAGAAADAALTPANRLAAMLKEALAANTIGGKVEDDSRWRAAADEVRQAQASLARIGHVPEATRRALADRFHRASRRIFERPGMSGGSGRAGASGASGRPGGSAAASTKPGGPGGSSGSGR
jgi:hypothetical protein